MLQCRGAGAAVPGAGLREYPTLGGCCVALYSILALLDEYGRREAHTPMTKLANHVVMKAQMKCTAVESH